jgi:hypothetical protein
VWEESSIGEGKTKPSTPKTMKLSVETKVAAALAAGFAVLTFGAIAQENSVTQSGYSPTTNPGLNIDISQEAYNSSLPDRSNAEENSD